MKNLHVAVVGATSLIGQECTKVLKQREFPLASLSLLAPERAVGQKVHVDHEELLVREIAPQSFKNIDLAFFSAGPDVSKHFVPIAAQSGAIVIDHSATFRMHPRVPLVVPEVNPQDLDKHRGIIANPNCATIEVVLALASLHRVNPVKRIIVDAFLPVSASGSAGMEELTQQSRQVLEGKPATAHTYPHQIAYNLLPQVDVFLDSGYSKEEWKIISETRKIMHNEELPVSATCIRVPVYVGYCEAVHAEFTRTFPVADAHRLLVKMPGIKVLDDPVIGLYPHPWAVAGRDEVFVGRLREDVSHPNGLALWIATDNLRKGAALNAVQIAEFMIKGGLI